MSLSRRTIANIENVFHSLMGHCEEYIDDKKGRPFSEPAFHLDEQHMETDPGRCGDAHSHSGTESGIK